MTERDCKTCLYEHASGTEYCGCCDDVTNNYKQDPFFAECSGCKKLQAENAKLKEELEQHRWIPVGERLPKEGLDVLYITRIPGDYAICFYEQGGWDDPNMGFTDNVTHWKPLTLPE